MQGRAGKGEKKKWVRPELVVLVRGRPEEAVLTNCKAGDHWGFAGVTGYQAACFDSNTSPCSNSCPVLANS